MRKPHRWFQSLFSWKIRGGECKTIKRASMTVSVMCEHELLVEGAAEDEQKERLQWFHTTFWMLL